MRRTGVSSAAFGRRQHRRHRTVIAPDIFGGGLDLGRRHRRYPLRPGIDIGHRAAGAQHGAVDPGTARQGILRIDGAGQELVLRPLHLFGLNAAIEQTLGIWDLSEFTAR